MSLTRTRLRVAVRVMGYYNSVPFTEAMPVIAPVRGRTTSLLLVMIMVKCSYSRRLQSTRYRLYSRKRRWQNTTLREPFPLAPPYAS